MASGEWHYVKEGKSYPPVTWNVLVQMARAGKLDPNDQIWNESLPRWISASSVEGLIPSNQPASDSYSQDTAQNKSWLGLISVLMGIFFCLGEIILVVIAGILGSQPDGLSEKSPEAVLLGLMLIGGVAGAVVGAILGLVAIFQSNSNKIIAAFGIALNGMCALGVIGLIVLGLVMGR